MLPWFFLLKSCSGISSVPSYKDNNGNLETFLLFNNVEDIVDFLVLKVKAFMVVNGALLEGFLNFSFTV